MTSAEVRSFFEVSALDIHFQERSNRGYVCAPYSLEGRLVYGARFATYSYTIAQS